MKIIKYIFVPRGLSKGDDDYFLDIDLNEIFEVPEGEPKIIFENEFCQKYDFEIDKLNRKHIDNLYNFFKFNDELLQYDDNFITNLLDLLTKIRINII